MRIVKYSSEAIGTLCLALASYFISSGQQTISLCLLLFGVMFWVIGLALKVQRDFGLIDEEGPTVLGLNNTPITRGVIQQEPPPADRPVLQDTESNIVVCWDGQDNSHRITVARNQERLYFREATDDEEDRSLSWRTVIVQFRNESSPPKRIGRVGSVTAEILYYESNNHDVVAVRTTGCWLNEPFAAIPFDPDVPRYLVLALFWRIQTAQGVSFNLDVYDASHPDFMVWRNAATEIGYKIVVKLRWGEHNEFGTNESFELISTIAGKFKSFELFRLTDQMSSDGQRIKISRGDMDLW